MLTLPWLPITENGWAVHAGPGTFLGLEDVLLEKGLASSIVAVTDVVLWRVSSKALKAILRSCPDLSLHLFRAAFGQLETRTEELQVTICHSHAKQISCKASCCSMPVYLQSACCGRPAKWGMGCC